MSSIRPGQPRADGTVPALVRFREYDETLARVIQPTVTCLDMAEAIWFKDLLDVKKMPPSEARAMLNMRRGVAVTPRMATPTIVEWCTTYIDSLTKPNEETKKRYRRFVVNDIAPFFGEGTLLSALCAIAPDDAGPVQEWVNEMLDNKASPKTVKNKVFFFCSALEAAMQRRPPLLKFNPAKGIQLPPHHYEAAFLETDEFDLVYQLVQPWWRPLVLFAVATGARPQEYFAATVGDIARYRNRDGAHCYTYRIHQAWKYSTDELDLLGTTKTKKGTRTVNLPAPAFHALDLNRAKTELLFPTEHGTRITSARFHNDCWKPMMANLQHMVVSEDVLELRRMGRQLGCGAKDVLLLARNVLAKHPRPYDLRHTCASWMINNGAALPDVQEHMGHDSYETTRSVYGHLDRRAGERATLALSEALSLTMVGRAANE